MNQNQWNTTSYKRARRDRDSASMSEADAKAQETLRNLTQECIDSEDWGQNDPVQQFGSRIDLLFPNPEKKREELLVYNLLEKFGQPIACALLSDAVGAQVTYREETKMFSWGMIEDDRYQPRGVTYEMMAGSALRYDESGHIVSPLRWHRSTQLALTCGVDLTHGYRSEFAFVQARFLDGTDPTHDTVVIQLTGPASATHLLIRSFWGGAHSMTRGMPSQALTDMALDEHTLFVRQEKSAAGGEGVDYFGVEIDPDNTLLKDSIMNAYLHKAATVQRMEEIFWERYTLIQRLHDDRARLEDVYSEASSTVNESILECEALIDDTMPLLHAPRADGMPKVEPLKSDEDLLVYSTEELWELLEQQEKTTGDIAAYAAKFQAICQNWINHARAFESLNGSIEDGWMEVFGDHAVLTFPKLEDIEVVDAVRMPDGVIYEQIVYEQMVFPLSAKAFIKAAEMVKQHAEDAEADKQAAMQMLTKTTFDRMMRNIGSENDPSDGGNLQTESGANDN